MGQLTHQFRGEASVSSPGRRLYPKGSTAQVVGNENGWLHLLDPTTKERGWVYHTYVAPIDRPSDDQLYVASTADGTADQPEVERSSPTVKVVSPKSRDTTDKPSARPSDSLTSKAKWRERKVRRAELRRGRGLFRLRKARDAWTLGPGR